MQFMLNIIKMSMFFGTGSPLDDPKLTHFLAVFSVF